MKGSKRMQSKGLVVAVLMVLAAFVPAVASAGEADLRVVGVTVQGDTVSVRVHNQGSQDASVGVECTAVLAQGATETAVTGTVSVSAGGTVDVSIGFSDQVVGLTEDPTPFGMTDDPSPWG